MCVPLSSSTRLLIVLVAMFCWINGGLICGLNILRITVAMGGRQGAV